jgi:hypothetical protein
MEKAPLPLWHFYLQTGFYLAIFAFFITFLNKNNIKFIISVENCVDWYINRDVSVQKNFFNFFVWGTLHDFFRKIFFRQKYTSDMSLDSVFNGDHESAMIFMKICTWKMKIVKYEHILAYSSRHFSNSIPNNCSKIY